MKKFILPLIFFFLMLFPTNILAENKDCLATWNSERYACAGAYRKCYEQCGAAPGIAPDSCYKSCDNTSEVCKKEADANFETCKNTSKNKTSASSEVKELQPTAMPTTTEESNLEDCWGKYMAADGCTPQFAACTRECPKDASTAQRACEDACTKESRACRDESSANYRACVADNTKSEEEGTKSRLQDQPQTSQGQPVSQSEPKKDGSMFSIFGINPFETWLNLKGLAEFPQLWLDATTEMEIFILEGLGKSNFVKQKYGKGNGWESVVGKDSQVKTEVDPNAILKFSDLPKRTPELTEEVIKQYRQERAKMMESGRDKVSPYSIDILRGQAQIKYPNENQWRDVKVGEKIPQGSTIFTGMDSTTVLTIENKGVVQIAPFSEVIINESGLEQATLDKELFNDIELDKGEIEVNIESGVFTAPILDVHTPNATTSVRGTHFWVSYKDNQTAVGVYVGKVEVKTKDGRVKEITPNSDQPGVMVVSQKLSPVKLGIAGVVSAAVLGGVIMILKRKFAPRINKKKK